MESHELAERQSNEDHDASRITRYTVRTDGTITESTDTEPDAEQSPAIADIHIVEGISAANILKARQLLPSLPVRFFDLHRCENLASIDTGADLQHHRLVLAKWSGEAAQHKEIWLREARLRSHKTPYNVNNSDPVESRLDHERYDHFSDPYRSYDPLFEFLSEEQTTTQGASTLVGGRETGPSQNTIRRAETDLERARNTRRAERPTDTGNIATKNITKRMMLHASHECISAYHDSIDGRLVCKYKS
jgi:hypothetical protein